MCAGDHCGILCRGVKVDAVKRGMWVGAVGAVTTSNFFKVFYIFFCILLDSNIWTKFCFSVCWINLL